MTVTVINTPHCTRSVRISGRIGWRNAMSTTRNTEIAVIREIIRYSLSKARSISLTITELPTR